MAWIRDRLKAVSAPVFPGPEGETVGNPPSFSVLSWGQRTHRYLLCCRDSETRTSAVVGTSPRTTEFHSDANEGAELPPGVQMRSFAGGFLEREKADGLSGRCPVAIYNLGNVPRIGVISGMLGLMFRSDS